MRFGSNNNNNNIENVEMERALSEMLLRMSYMHGSRHGNIVIQPELSYEELLERFRNDLDENRRGASEEIIRSYPVVLVGEEDDKVDAKRKKEQEAETEEKKDYGTCGICLEDYQKGERTKALCCPHSFHAECIDRWLKQVASCPVCKKEVEMYRPERVEGKPTATA
jgi:hypothetical protein